MASTLTWVRKALNVAKLPRIQLNNIQDLPGAKKKVSSRIHFVSCHWTIEVPGNPSLYDYRHIITDRQWIVQSFIPASQEK